MLDTPETVREWSTSELYLGLQSTPRTSARSRHTYWPDKETGGMYVCREQVQYTSIGVSIRADTGDGVRLLMAKKTILKYA